ncbi:hypothetical protein LTR09_008008 [Extremus antarcticus]|uniref:Uncharacterized protein n=1 Tax=Extremus antarcticus TaxID=702011 RepID=A0AAJ0DIC3_9PEZI|nr:hypothetical protein LTR09_008008 [Extremus antarcticus]
MTYDVPSVRDGRFFRLDDHLTRRESSCAKMRFKLPPSLRSRAKLKRTLIKMVARSGIRDAFVQIMITRGLVGIRERVAQGKFLSRRAEQ